MEIETSALIKLKTQIEESQKLSERNQINAYKSGNNSEEKYQFGQWIAYEHAIKLIEAQLKKLGNQK